MGLKGDEKKEEKNGTLGNHFEGSILGPSGWRYPLRRCVWRSSLSEREWVESICCFSFCEVGSISANWKENDARSPLGCSGSISLCGGREGKRVGEILHSKEERQGGERAKGKGLTNQSLGWIL